MKTKRECKAIDAVARVRVDEVEDTALETGRKRESKWGAGSDFEASHLSRDERRVFREATDTTAELLRIFFANKRG